MTQGLADENALVEELAAAAIEEIARRAARPVSTYRLQFHPQHFRFADAVAIVPYLHRLGVTHIYCSPLRRTVPGSENSYAIVDYNSVNPELGGEDGYRAMVGALQRHGMGHLLDIVPNHMNITPGENAWWTNVLENGPSSPYACFFDINWEPQHEELRNRILLPVLGEQYGQVLEAGQLRVEYREGALGVRYWQTVFPLDPRSYGRVLRPAADALKHDLPADEPDFMEFESILTALDYLPETTETAPARVAERQREKEVVKQRLRLLEGKNACVGERLREALGAINGTPGDASSFDRLDELLDSQVYRLSHWKAAADEINYRRFFDINELAAVCTEEPRVFCAIHEMVFDLVVRGELSGLRIDHIDGLLNPTEYLWRLQWGFVRAMGRALFHARVPEAAAADRAHVAAGHLAIQAEPRRDDRAETAAARSEAPLSWAGIEALFMHAVWRRLGGVPPESVFPRLRLPSAAYSPAPANDATAAEGDIAASKGGVQANVAARAVDGREEVAPAQEQQSPFTTPPAVLPLFVVVEKILSPDEPLPQHWPVAGTTGYDFLALLNGLFIDRAGMQRVIRGYERYTDQYASFPEIAHASKLLILRIAMSSELMLLAHQLNRLSERHRRFRDFTLNTLRMALREILASFPVYRTYLGPNEVSPRDRQVVLRAVAHARRRNPAMSSAVLDFVRDVLLFEQPPNLDEQGQLARALFVGRFQQVTSPVTAKGIEDTAFYRYVPLCSANEVGGDPDRASVAIDDFHVENLARHARWPANLLATTTHDTKRSEDVRARISVLSEIPQLWQREVNRWTRLNRRFRREVDGQPAPSRNDEYLFYQTLVGAWPLDIPSGDEWATFVERIRRYMEKAGREAKLSSSWLSPNAEYETALSDFVAAALERGPRNRFLRLFGEFQGRIAAAGQYTALSQTVLKLFSPGTPDVYQGQEVWNLSLVDPDNRRPVDYRSRQARLDEIIAAYASDGAALARQLGARPFDDRLKLYVTWRALAFRREHRNFFRQARYRTLNATGPLAEHVCAFAYESPGGSGSNDASFVAVLAPRLIGGLMKLGSPDARAAFTAECWGNDTHIEIPGAKHQKAAGLFSLAEIAGGEMHSLADVLRDFPVEVVSNLARTA